MSKALVNGLPGSKKAQGLSLNTIIIAIIVIIVLVVLVMIFTGYFGKKVVPTINSCAANGGQCAAECSGQLGNQLSYKCSDETLKCCSSVQTTFETNKEPTATCKTQGGDCYVASANDESDPACTATPPTAACKKVPCGNSKFRSIGTVDCGAKVCCV